MFTPVTLNIGLRYTKAKKRNHFISFIALFSMIGIALGVAVLITVMSVMNGFDEQIKTRFFAMAPQITVSKFKGAIKDWEPLQQQLKKLQDVTQVVPYIAGQGMLTSSLQQVQPVMVSGIDPNQEARVSHINQKMVEGSLSDLQAGKFGIVLGETLADSLGVRVGEKITLMIPEATITLAGVLPRLKRFTLVGVFNAGTGFKFNSGWAFVNLQDAQKLYRFGDGVTGLRLKLTDMDLVTKVASKIREVTDGRYIVSTWMQSYGALFEALKLEKTMMFFILLLIIAIAGFNLICTLVMVVTDKQSDIAILRTLGATPRDIQKIFMVQGAMIGVFGTLVGIVGGVLLALNITPIVAAVERAFNIHFLTASIYWVDYLPSKLIWSDVAHVCVAALLICLLATLYPAWRAARTQPAEALRYE